MNDFVVAVVLVIAAALVGLLLRTALSLATYKARHPFTEADLEAAKRDAVRGSRLTKGGQITEQLAPLLPGFCELFNPKDARFLGSPIDFIVFDGLEEGRVKEVVFLEIKSSENADLNGRQRQVKRVIHEGGVRFQTLRPLKLARD